MCCWRRHTQEIAQAAPQYPPETQTEKGPDLAAQTQFLERSLLERLQPDEAALTTLARDRARAVQDALFVNPELNPERVFITAERTEGKSESGTVRMEMKLRVAPRRLMLTATGGACQICASSQRSLAMHSMTKSGLLALLALAACDRDCRRALASDVRQCSSCMPNNLRHRTSCLSNCDAAETRCSSEVRRARQQCSKVAANAGRDPFTMRNNDYTYFCGYFNNAGACGAGSYSNSCKSRFARTYGLCIDAIQQNIASMRYDCYQNENDSADIL